MASSSMAKNLNKIVEEPIKENGIWIFSDTECKADKKVCYTWIDLFQAQEVNRPETKPVARKLKNSKCSISNQISGEG